MNFANLIVELRKERGISQKALADNIGISQSAIAKLELGKNEATASTLIKLSRFFNISIDSLVGLEPDVEDSIFNTNLSTSLSKNEELLLKNFRKLPSDLRHRAEIYMEKLVELIEEESSSTFPVRKTPSRNQNHA